MPIQVKRAGADEYSRHVKALICGEPGAGKGLPLSTPILAPTGWILLDQVEPGTALIGSNGKAVTCTAVFDRGVQPTYRISFDDGATIVCDADHLWSVQSAKTHYESGNWMVLSTSELMRRAQNTRTDRKGKPAWFMPLVAPVQFDKVELPVEPYLLGLLLANGHFGQGHCTLTTNNEALVRRAMIGSPHLEFRERTVEGNARRWTVAGMQSVLRKMGLDDVRSAQKFIPSEYLTAHEEARRALLAGLCDADGSKRTGNRRPVYYTTSPELRDGVVSLVRSLGGVTRVSEDRRQAGEGRSQKYPATCFQVAILGVDPFSVPEKAGFVAPVWRAITSIEPYGSEPTRCLTVEAPDGLFVTDHYLVTHNTRTSSTWPHVLYANIEGGLMSVVDRQPAFVDVGSIDDLNQLYLGLRQTPKVREQVLGCQVETVVIDTLDALQKLLIVERLAAEKKEAMVMQDWGWLGDQLRTIVRNFRNLDLNVLFACHVKTVEDGESGAVTIKPALQGAMGDEIAAYVDIAGYLKASPLTVMKDGKAMRSIQRVLQVAPDPKVPWCKDRTGKLGMEVDIDLTTDYARIAKAVYPPNVAAPSIAVATADPASAAQRPRQQTRRPEPAAAPPAQALSEPVSTPTPEQPQAARPQAPEPPRRPVEERAGTQIDHAVAHQVVLERNGKQIVAGLIDSHHGLYQLGGDLAKLVLWKDRLLGLGMDEWETVKGAGLDTIEVVDLVKNECWRVPVSVAADYGRPYDAGVGARFGIPVDAFTVYDKDWNLLRAASIGTEPEIPEPELEQPADLPVPASDEPANTPEPLPEVGEEPSREPERPAAPAQAPTSDPDQQVLSQEAPAGGADQAHQLVDPSMICSKCGNVIESEDQRDLSLIRYREPLCRADFQARKVKR